MSHDNDPRQLFERAVAACRAGDMPRGLTLFRRAINAAPDNPAVASHVGVAMMSFGAVKDAHDVLAAAAQRHPSNAAVLSDLGGVLLHLGRPRDAMQAWQRALSLDPTLASARLNLANLLQRIGRPDDSLTLLNELTMQSPDNATAWRILAHIYRDYGRIDEAIAAFDRAIELEPDNQSAHDALLFTLLFHDRPSWREVVARHVAWSAKFADALTLDAPPHANDRKPDRRLRIGYVAPFHANHVITDLIVPIFQHHDRTQFELLAYCNLPQAASAHDRLAPLVDQWKQCERLSHQDLAATIRADAIDVLIDLNAHMSSCRLLALAHKPAPVQISYLSYPATTGLRAMDYRVTCSGLDPPGSEIAEEPERLIRLPDTFWCYPVDAELEIGPPPSEAAGHVTFGCLNAFVKVRDACLELWSRILETTPGSRLQVLVQGGEGARSVMSRFGQAKIDPARVQVLGYAGRREHLQRFNSVDVFLDSFPYGGHVTTHDALWMGVPVIAMAGDTPVSRAGECILSQVGLRSLVARSAEEYIDLAVQLANDTPRRSALRRQLRDDMRRSPLTDAQRFVQHLEAGYRAAWNRWCEGLAPSYIDVPSIA